MSQDYTPDEITFALYFDNELDLDEATKFEAALNANPELLAQYNLWAEMQEQVCAHFETLEKTYSLEGFTERVMNDLPQTSPWKQPSSEHISHTIEVQESSWFKRLLIPILVGGLTAAVVVFILSRRNELVLPHTDQATQRPETQLIDHKVTWLENDEEDETEDPEEVEGEGEDEGEDEDEGI